MKKATAKGINVELLQLIDVAAAHLLQRAGVSGIVEPEHARSEAEAPLTEQVKAFQAVVDWAKSRHDLVPAGEEGSKFNGLKQQFFGSSSGGGGVRAKKPKAANGTAIASDPEPSPGAGVFDA